jgi:V/A-type H+/Na+-transporting ATPase subunit F
MEGGEKMEIAVIGPEEFTIGFRLAGVKRIHIVSQENLLQAIEQIMKDRSVGIIVLDNNDWKTLPAYRRSELSESVNPTFIAIGKVEEVDLREKIKQAVGVDLWK